MKKYRVVKRGDGYVPQRRKRLFFWTDWFEGVNGCIVAFTFDSREAAERFIAKKEAK